MKFETTNDIQVPSKLVDMIIGQEEAVEIIKKAAKQRRHVLLIGEPGTGKSMLGMALAQLLPKEKLVDILSFQNGDDENTPLIRIMPAGQGKTWVQKARAESQTSTQGQSIFVFIILIILSIIPYLLWRFELIPDVVYAASLIATMLLFVGVIFMLNVAKRMAPGQRLSVPKVIVDNAKKTQAPFLDATGAHAGALLGDVLHDPFQSGGLGTPAHERVVAGMIHKSHLGVLFIDEIATLAITTQQELLTAIQEGKFSVTGQSERSAGAMVRTEAVPCNFILIAAGNIDSVTNMHPALRSRIRGYGYEVYMRSTMPDTQENRDKIAIFVAQEIIKDKKIPPFSKEAVDMIIEEARRKANRKGHLTLRLRELGGVIRAAGDFAITNNDKLVQAKHILMTRESAKSLEHQIADRHIEHEKEYQVIQTKGVKIGRVNGLAVMGDGSSFSGIVKPIEATITGSMKGNALKVTATGKLGDIAKESVTNVSALIKTLFDKDLDEHAIFVQFMQSYSGVDGDSASIAIAVAIISAVTKVPVKQDVAMTGSLSVRGTILPIGGATYKIEAAIEADMKTIIIPWSNKDDVVIEKKKLKGRKVIPVKDLVAVLEHALDWSKHKTLLAKVKKNYEQASL